MDMLGNIFSEDTMKQMSGLGSLPAEAVSPGDTWTEEREFPLMGKWKTQILSEYLGPEIRDGKQLEKIRVELKLDVTPDKEQQAGLQVNFTEQEYAGTVYFDNGLGRFTENRAKMKIKMEISIGEQTMTVDNHVAMHMKLQPEEASEQPVEDE
jgi:hypothetical protein